MWKRETLASEAMRFLFTNASNEKLEMELKARQRPTPNRRRQVFQFVIASDEPIAPEESIEFSIDVSADGQYTFLTCVSKIIPSPDWFIGLPAIDLCTPDAEFNSSFETRLFGFDGGIDSASDYDQVEPLPDDKTENIVPLLVQGTNGYGNFSITQDGVRSGEAEASKEPVACFPADEPVQLHTGEYRQMRHLRTSDRVRTGLASRSSPIFMFSHLDDSVFARFLKLVFIDLLGNEAALRVTPGHYIYIAQRPPFRKPRLVAARDVKRGDFLIAADGELRRIERIERVVARGLYNPHSMDGNLVVSGVRVSCFTTALQPAAASAWLVALKLGHYMHIQMAVDWVWKTLLSGRWNARLHRLVSVEL